MARYHIKDFMMSNNIVVMPEIQERPVSPFTMRHAKRLFDNFRYKSFEFDGIVKSIVITNGEENLPEESFAMGYLMSETLDDMQLMKSWPDSIGTIDFECGGNLGNPIIRVEKE